MANMVGQVLEGRKITFHEDELPLEGLRHKKSLHITVQCKDYFFTRIMIDGGSGLNICSLVTLKKLGKGLHKIKDRAINVKAFDGSQRSTIGKIILCLQMGPTWFETFQQADIIGGSDEEEALVAMRNLFLEDSDVDCCVILEEEGEEGPSIQARRKNIEFLKEYEDIFAWLYDDMAGLSASIVAHKQPTDPICPPVKQKLRKFKPNMSLKIKEEVTKQVKSKVLRVVEYPTWLANIVPVPKKDGKIWMDEVNAEKTASITPWGMYCYRMMPFGQKNVGATYMRAMTTIFHDMIHKEIENLFIAMARTSKTVPPKEGTASSSRPSRGLGDGVSMRPTPAGEEDTSKPSKGKKRKKDATVSTSDVMATPCTEDDGACPLV
ncbi:uncharacterized protein [Nicotiana sylvestris]|uniref:uncharacterized protein n=1 Tax=Nicotiana sylvestris TaxID=4096 RepID=UPI00388CC814